MKGMETILQQLQADAATQADAILDSARQEVNDIIARCQAQADQERQTLLERGRQAAAEREERIVSAAQLRGRNQMLSLRQELLAAAYDRALEKLLKLPQAQLTEVLTALLLQASPQGRGEVLFPPGDKAGAQAVAAANAKTGGHLTLSKETAPIQGGFILRQGSVEVNCAFETLIRLQRADTAAQAAAQLFG